MGAAGMNQEEHDRLAGIQSQLDELQKRVDEGPEKIAAEVRRVRAAADRRGGGSYKVQRRVGKIELHRDVYETAMAWTIAKPGRDLGMLVARLLSAWAANQEDLAHAYQPSDNRFAD